jgi:hypothetical protein
MLYNHCSNDWSSWIVRNAETSADFLSNFGYPKRRIEYGMRTSKHGFQTVLYAPVLSKTLDFPRFWHKSCIKVGVCRCKSTSQSDQIIIPGNYNIFVPE